MYFCWRPPGWQPLAFDENPRTNLEVQGPFGDDVTFQECRTSWKLKIWLFCETRLAERGSQKVAPSFPTLLCIAKIHSIAIWANFVSWEGSYWIPIELWGTKHAEVHITLKPVRGSTDVQQVLRHPSRSHTNTIRLHCKDIRIPLSGNVNVMVNNG